MKSTATFISILILVVFQSYCPVYKQDLLNKTGYDLSNPTTRYELPVRLNEISGITNISDNELGCIQDEQGIIFIFHLDTGTVQTEIPFAHSGDYEGIALAGNDMYILRSDGLLTGLYNYKNPSFRQKNYTLPIPSLNNEDFVLTVKITNC